MTTKTLFNSDQHCYEDENLYSEMESELDYILNETVAKGRGVISGYGMVANRSSRYGSIGGAGQVGYMKSNEVRLSKAILGVSSNSDKITVKDNDGELQVNYHDHDGIHHVTFKRITSSREESFNNMLVIGTHDEIIEYLDKLPSVKVKKTAFL